MIFVGIDWADERHRVVVLTEDGTVKYRGWVSHDALGVQILEDLFLKGTLRQDVHVAVELHDSLLLDQLLRLGVTVYGLNPKSAQRVRERFTPAGLKDDDRDAWSLAEFIRTSRQHLRPLRPDSPITTALREWVSLREDLVQERTTQLQRLHNHLVRWHPQIAAVADDLNREWVLDLLVQCPTADTLADLSDAGVKRWSRGRRLHAATKHRLALASGWPSPTCVAARNPAHAAEVRHRVTLIREINRRLSEVDATLADWVARHPDAFIFQSLPSCGPATVAALLAGFGEDRQRWSGWEEVAARWGTAPITLQSGKHRTVRRRAACDSTMHQVWLWFAFNTIRKEGCWARTDYQAKRKGGGEHYTTLRAIADRWIKIAYRCWFNRTPYDEALHQRNRAERLKQRMPK